MGHVLYMFLKSNFNNNMEVFNLKNRKSGKNDQTLPNKGQFKRAYICSTLPLSDLRENTKMKGFYKEMDLKWKAFVGIHKKL